MQLNYSCIDENQVHTVAKLLPYLDSTKGMILPLLRMHFAREGRLNFETTDLS